MIREFSLSKPELKALWAKIESKHGGEAGLIRILEDFYQRMSEDILIGFFFDGKDLKEIAATQKDFLMRAMGAKASYAGKAPADAHEKIAPILAGHFDRRLVVLEQTLKDHGLGAEDIRVWLGFENAFRDGIVKK